MDAAPCVEPQTGDLSSLANRTANRYLVIGIVITRERRRLAVPLLTEAFIAQSLSRDPSARKCLFLTHRDRFSMPTHSPIPEQLPECECFDEKLACATT